MTKVAIIGCGDAGLSAAFAASKHGAKVTVIAEEDVWYPRCPLPYFIGGEIDEKDLVKPLEKVFRGTGITVINDRATGIKDKKVICDNCEVSFDKLILATGGTAKHIPGSLSLRTIKDAKKIKELNKTNKPVIVGGGMLGCELADVLGGTIIEAKKQILSVLDPEFAEIIYNKLVKKVDIRTGTKKIPKSELTISAIGVVPDLNIAKKSNIKSSEFGIIVDNRLETNIPDVYAAGDCIEERCFFRKIPMNSYLGPQAERQGVIAGVNAAGGDMRYEGSLGAAVAKIAGYEVGSTGLCGLDLDDSKMKYVFGKIRTKTKPDYEKNAKELIVKMLFVDEKLVGCQAIGGESVEGIINLASYAMQHGATVTDLINLAYCFSPPICSAPNPIVLCAENAKRRMRK